MLISSLFLSFHVQLLVFVDSDSSFLWVWSLLNLAFVWKSVVWWSKTCVLLSCTCVFQEGACIPGGVISRGSCVSLCAGSACVLNRDTASSLGHCGTYGAMEKSSSTPSTLMSSPTGILCLIRSLNLFTGWWTTWPAGLGWWVDRCGFYF